MQLATVLVGTTHNDKWLDDEKTMHAIEIVLNTL